MCPLSNFLRVISVSDKSATTAARALLQEVFLPYGFPSVLQSDRGGEWFHAVMHRLTTLLSIRHAFTSGFRPRLNSSTERAHRFLNSALGVYCEFNQERWEDYLQPAVYAPLNYSEYFSYLWHIRCHSGLLGVWSPCTIS